MAQRGSETAPAITRSIAIIIQPLIVAPMVGPSMICKLVVHPPIPAQKVSPGPAIAAATYHMVADAIADATYHMTADDDSTRIVYTVVIAIIVGGLVQSAITTWIWERLYPKRSSPPTATTRTVATQSQTTYKWWWSEPRYVPLPEHSHGAGLIDPFLNPRRG